MSVARKISSVVADVRQAIASNIFRTTLSRLLSRDCTTSESVEGRDTSPTGERLSITRANSIA